jgi:hypothetical protein
VYADSARVRYEAYLNAQPDEAMERRELALAYAYLGRRAQAVGAARRALELLPIGRNAMLGTDNLINLARVSALVGDSGTVVETVERLLGTTSWVSPTYLRIDPLWEPYRRVERFRKLLAL